ncbi:Csu type fimbrial protein [Sphingomonas fennica]|uniref:Csu type fimbrial protein n=1 Tax=Edaphosphingomonas fennica TaxID=114404 RepID=UPI001474C879|nr:spore coat U domain-containing protein [Sphingomonas fennica]
MARSLFAFLCGSSVSLQGVAVALVGVPLMVTPTPAFAGCGTTYTSTMPPRIVYHTSAWFTIQVGITCDHRVNWVKCPAHHVQFPGGISADNGAFLARQGGGGQLFFYVYYKDHNDAAWVSQSANNAFPPVNGTEIGIPSYNTAYVSGSGRWTFIQQFGSFIYDFSANRAANHSPPAGTYSGWVQPRLYSHQTGNFGIPRCATGQPGFEDGYPAQRLIPLTVEVPPQCEIWSAADLDFGQVDPGIRKTAQANVRVRCNGNYAATLTADLGKSATQAGNPQFVRNMVSQSGGSDKLPYRLYQDAAHTLPLGPSKFSGKYVGGEETHTQIYAVIEAADTSVTPGRYSDTVTLKIEY